MTRQKLKPLLLGVVVVMALLFVMFVPVLGYADEGHVEEIPHSESSELPIQPIEEDDDFVGDKHTDHAHEITIKGPWWKDGQWWVFFIVSLFLMALLSFWVYRYLQVKE